MTAFTMLASQIIMSFMMLMFMFVLMPRAQVSASRINQVLETKSSIAEPETDAERTEEGTLEFKNVSFAYPDSELPVIKNIGNFRIVTLFHLHNKPVCFGGFCRRNHFII